MYEIVTVEPAKALLSIEFIERLAFAVADLKLSRRKTADWLAETIFGWLEQGNIIVDANGKELPIEDDTIDTAHGKDGGFFCVSALKRSVGQKRQRRPRNSLLSRLQLYDAAFKIVGKPLVSREAPLESSRQ